MATLDDFRQLPQYKDFSDEQLVVTLSQKYGIEPGEIAQEFGVSYNPQRNPLGAGLSAGVDQLQGLGYGAIGAGARALGAEGVADWADRGVTRNYAESTFNGRPDLERIEDQSLGSALPFLGYQVAKQVPMLAGTLAASAAVPQAAIPAALSRGLAVIPKGLGGGGLKAGMDFAGRRAALEAGNAFGRTIAASYPIGVGAMYGEAVERGDPTQGDALAALGLGVPYGAAEAVMPSMVRNAFGSNAARFAGGLPTRLAKAGGLGFAGESGTELFQNELEMGFAGNLTQDEIDSRRLNSAVIGGLVGGTFNLPAGFRGQRNPADPIDILNRDTSPQPEAAPQVGQSELNFGITGEEAIGTRGLRNPFDAAGYVSGFQQGRETTVDVPQSDLFGGVNEMPPVDIPRAPKIDIPVPQPLQSDPVRSAVAQASPATLRKDGTLKDIVEKALGAYSEFSDGEIAAALEEFAASKRKDTVWRVAALEAIARQRAPQGAPNVAQVDAASDQGAGAVPAGSAGNTPSGPVVIDGVRQPAGAPAPGSAARVPVGEPVVQQPASVADRLDTASSSVEIQQVLLSTDSDVLISAALNRPDLLPKIQSGMSPPAWAMFSADLAAAQQGTPIQNVPPTQQVAPQAQEARGQEGAQVGAEQSRDAERAQVSRIFDTLSEREREILTKYHFDKMTFEEIGSELKERGESGTTRQRIEQQHKGALNKLAEAGRPFGLTPERLRLYFPDESRRMAGGADVQTASAAEVAQSGAGMTYRDESNNGAVNQANDEFEMADAVDGAEALDLDTDIAREEFDEGFRGEQGADVDALEQVEAMESMTRTERDHKGIPLQPVDFEDAASDYDLMADEGDTPFAELPRQIQVQWVKAWVAAQDGALTDQQLVRVFSEIADQYVTKAQTVEPGAAATAQRVQENTRGESQNPTDAREEVTPTPATQASEAGNRVDPREGNSLSQEDRAILLAELEKKIASVREKQREFLARGPVKQNMSRVDTLGGEKSIYAINKQRRDNKIKNYETMLADYEQVRSILQSATPIPQGFARRRVIARALGADINDAAAVEAAFEKVRGGGTGTQAQYLTEDRSEFRGTVDGLHGASTPVLNVTDPSEVPPRLRNDAGAWSDGESDGFYFAEPEDRSWFRGSKIRMPDFRYAYEVNVRFNRAFLLTPQTLERFVEQFGTDPMGAVRAMREQGFDGVVTRGFDTDWQVMDALVEQHGLEGGAMSWGPMLMDQAVSFDPAKNVRITGRDGKLTEAIRRVTTAESRLRLLAKRAGIDLDAARVANARYNENVGTPNEEYYSSQPGAAEAARFFARDDVVAAVAEVERANNAVLDLAEQPRGEPRFSRTADTQGTTVEAVRSAINDIATPMGRRKVTVYQTADEAVQNGALNSKDAKGTQGWVDDNGNAFFIAGNIPNGSELAVVLHEIGAHLGIEKLLTDKQYEALVKKIFAWAQSDANTQEARIARTALARVESAKLENDADVAPEVIAYFVEEAVKSGVNPTAMQYKTELGRWFRTLWAAFKVALRRLNLINADRLTAQNVVDLAYGAARVQLAGQYHGTAANFRRFDHRYMGSGEGAQAFGWGTYLAQRFGIANEYFEADVRRKGEDSSVRALQIDGVPVVDYRAALDSSANNNAEINALTTLDVVSAFRIGWKTKDEIVQDAVEQLRHGMPWQTDYAAADWLENNADRISIKEASKPEGNIHITDINATEDELLDWDKPLSEQSPQVRETLEALALPDSARFTKARDVAKIEFTETTNKYDETVLDGVLGGDALTLTISKTFGGGERVRVRVANLRTRQTEFSGAFDSREAAYDAIAAFKSNLQWRNMLAADPKGSSAYKFLEDALGSDKAASEYLDSLGVKGIKFLDAQSRGTPGNTFSVGGVTVTATRDPASLRPIVSALISVGVEQAIAQEAFELLSDSRNTDDPLGNAKFSAKGAVLDALNRIGRGDQNQTRNLVIFNDANIFRVGSMRGGPVGKGGRMMFSKINTSTPEGFFDAIRNRTADFFINPVGFMKEHGLGWLTLEQLADVVKSKSVSGYHRVMVAMQQFSKDRVHDAALIDVEWAKLSPNEQSRLSTVMRGATRASYDPENETPANDEQRTLNAQYEALTPAAKDIYLKVREYYSKNFEERKKILLDAANRAKAAGKNTSEVERMFAKVKGPYFPLMRIGGWYSVGMSPELADLMDKKERNEASAAELKRIETLRKDAKHYVSRGHTTRRDAELSRRELQAQLGVAYANRAEERIGQEVAQLPDMAKLEEYLAPHLPVGVRSQVRDMLAQAYFDALPEKSALKRQLKREGVHGEEEDMRRVFAASALSSAHHISRLKYANDLSEAMVKVRAEGRRDETLRMVGNELNKRTALALERQENPIVDRVLQVSYFANLGLSPAFLLTNMTQVPMITVPWLGARHGFAKATRALAEAFTDTKDMVRATYAGKGVKDGWRSEFDWSQKYPEGTDEHKLFRELLDRNLLDITMEHDLTAVAEVRNTKIDDAIKIANLPVRVTETVNRSITGLAAYRLARADGKSHEQAVEHAAKALSETQLNYSGLNTARHMQVVLGSKALARLMMQFRKFQQGMVYLIVKNAYDAVKAQGGTEAETKELRRIARKTLAGVFGTTGLMAGTLGLPFAGTVATVVGAVGGMLDDDDEPFDPVVEYRNFLTDMFGPEMAAVLAKGLPTLMNVDLSKRVGMGDIGTPLPFMRQGRTGTEAVNNTLGAAAGAWAGTTASMLDGIAFLANGDYAKAAEKIIPIKAAQNLVRGYRYDDQGLTNRNGELVVPAEKFSAWDIALRTAGFQPMREAEYYEANQAVEGAKRAAQDTRTKLLRQYAQAKLRGEPTADVDAEIKAFNERHPQKGLRIDYSARARAVQARRKMADERNEAGVRVDRTGALFEERGRFAAP